MRPRLKGYPLTATCLLFLLLSTAATSVTEDKPSPEQLVAQAHKLADLSSLGPYVLTGDFIVNPGTKQEVAGALVVHRKGSSARVDLQFGNRVDSRVSVGDKYFYNPSNILLGGNWLNQIDRSWDPELPQPGSGESEFKLERLSHSKISGRDAWCMERKYRTFNDRLCMDGKDGLVLRSSFMEFSGFKGAGPVWFPQTIKIMDPIAASIEVRNIKVTPFVMEAALFVPPAGAWEFLSCEDLVLPRAIETPEPATAPLSHHVSRGFLKATAFLNKDGHPEVIKLLTQLPEPIAARFFETVKKWRYKPATCNGQPINYSLDLQIDGKLF
jgi:hypothetical protein